MCLVSHVMQALGRVFSPDVISNCFILSVSCDPNQCMHEHDNASTPHDLALNGTVKTPNGK